ncbi:MAG: chorismate mutase [Thermodesulfobacteriaceae bacterium]|nr:chorismate mutase [Thermodesulfobacteriaceae bacterium]
MEKKLSELRKEIDRIDEELILLLKKRLQIAKEIGKIKESKGVQTFDLGREKEVIKRILELNEGVFP